MTSQLRHLPLWQIKPNPFEVRSYIDTESENFLDLVESIKEHGVIQPVLLRKHKNSLQIIAGTRRLIASRKAREKTIPVVIDNITDTKARILSLIENSHRENLTDTEKALSLVKIYESAGFTLKSAASLASKYEHSIRDDKPNSSIPTEFIEICDQIAIKPHSQRNYLYIARDLSPSVLKHTEKLKLNIGKKLLLSRPIIRKDPKLQKTVATMITKMDEKSARNLVHNIEEKNYTFTGKSFRINNSNVKATLKPQEFTGEARMFFTVNVGMINDLVGHFTDSFKKVYSDDLLDKTINFRLEKIKQLKEPDLYNWYNSMVPLINILDEMKKELEREFKTREKQRELIRQ